MSANLDDSPGNVADGAIGMLAAFRRHHPCWVVLWAVVGRRARAAWPYNLVYGRVSASVPDKRLGDAASIPPVRAASGVNARLGLANDPGASADPSPGTQDTGLQLPACRRAPQNGQMSAPSSGISAVAGASCGIWCSLVISV